MRCRINSGFTEFYWVVVPFPRLEWVLPALSLPFMATNQVSTVFTCAQIVFFKGFIGFQWVHSGFTWFLWVSLSFYGFCYQNRFC